jgi:hypothetical protein
MLSKLLRGDPRSGGLVNDLVADVMRDPSRLRPVLDGMLSSDAAVRLRSAKVVERISASRPDLLRPFAGRLLNETANGAGDEAQSQVALALPRIQLTDEQRRQAESILTAFLTGRSGVARAAAAKALADFALHDPAMRARIGPLLGDLARTGTTAARVGGRRLLERLANGGQPPR